MNKTKTIPQYSARFWTCSSPEDDVVWQFMTGEEQLAALQNLANHPDTNTRFKISMDDVCGRAVERCHRS